MKLAEFFANIEPFLLGKASHSETVSQLYGSSPPQPDSDRLAIYGRFCETHRHEVLDGVFPYLRTIVVDVAGESGWDKLVRAYFAAHPMNHFELNHNAAQLPAFLENAEAETLGVVLPDFAAALADFEWWEWQTKVVLESESDRPIDGGPLRLHSSVELRPYAFDLLSFVDRSDAPGSELEGSPERGDNLVLFWRDRHLHMRRDRVSPHEVLLIKAVFEQRQVDAELAALLSIPLSDLAALALDLFQAGIIIGDARLLPSSD